MTRRENPPRLTPRESELMALLWEHGPMFVKDMLTLLPDPKPHVNTISTTVRILEDKGFVSHEAVGGSHRYAAAVEPSFFRSRTLAQVIKDYFHNSYASAVSALAEEEKISADELRDILRMVEERHAAKTSDDTTTR